MSDAAVAQSTRLGRPVPRLGYRSELDGVRGVAILLVLLTHSSAFLPSGTGVLYSGFFGVDVFFVLSGFLITTLLLEEWFASGRIRLMRFYGRRALRLYPALVFALVLAGIATILVGSNLRGIAFAKAASYALLFVSNWSTRSLGFLAHTWALGVEMQFYVVWSLVVVVCLRRGVRVRRLAGAAGVGAVLVAGLRAMAVHGFGSTDLVHGIYRLDAILLGSALGALLFADRDRTASFLNRPLTVRWAAAGLFLYLAYAEASGRLGRSAVAKDLLFVGSASAAVLLGRLVTKPSAVSRALGSRAMVALGKLSYSLFLVHYPVFRTLARIGPENAIVSAVIGWTLSFALAVVSYMLIEQGVLRLKRRLSPARAAT